MSGLYENTRAVVIGYGVTGVAVSKFLIDNGSQVLVYADKVADTTFSDGIEISRIDERFPQKVKEADLVVVSPGVPRSHPVFSIAREPISELELASRHTKTPILAVTGTNGKTTVVSLIARMLERSGLRAMAVGNIGTTMISSLDAELDFFVVEASSFQLATTTTFKPRVAAFTNFSPDHLDWHQGIGHYLDSKAKIFANQGSGDAAVISGSDPMLRSVVIPPGVRVVMCGLGDFNYGLSADGQKLTFEGDSFVDLQDLPRRLPHDIENALVSAAVAHNAGVQLYDIGAALKEFHGLPHRVELVNSVDGVQYFNDSKATTPASVVAAGSGFESLVLIAGGRNKGLDLRPLKVLESRLKAMVAIGESENELEELFGSNEKIQFVKARSMQEAVELAREFAQAGDVVLLSPGCTSFDWYGSYAERGDDFRRIVNSMIVR